MSPLPRQRPATLSDLAQLPPGVKGEIIDGVLYTQPRPRPAHADVESLLVADLKSPFQRGLGGPGGWWILAEPGVTVPGSPEFAPDLAGWRRERLPALPETTINVVPDWICEILSQGNRRYDLTVKRPFYARIGVAHLWFVDLEARALVASKLVDGHWYELGVYADDARVRVPPFGAIELSLADWWPPLPAGVVEGGGTEGSGGG